MILSKRTHGLLAAAALAAILSTGLASPALAEGAAIAQKNPSAIEQSPTASKRALSFEQAADDAARLKEGADYDPRSLLVILDGRTEMAFGGKTVAEHARTSIAAQRSRGEVSAASVGKLIEVSSADLSRSRATSGNGLALLGDIEYTAAGSWLGGDVLARVEIPEGMTVSDAIEALLGDERVLEVFLDGRYETESFLPENMTIEVETNDPVFDSGEGIFHLTFAEVLGAWSYMTSQLNPGSSPEKYGVQTEGDVTVAVIDSGCDLDHPDLVGNIDLENAYDAVTDAPLTGDCADDSHGTHVCGIIAARANNGIGVAGVSYNAKVLPINAQRFDGYMYDSDIADAFDHIFDLIDAGNDSIRVVNMSFGGYDECSTELRSRLLEAADDYDLTLVASAGNDNTNQAHYPSDYPECISVVSVGEDGKSPSSNYGSGTDICAPGFSVLSTVDGGGYDSMGGTSMAAPVVSGIAALLYAMVPDATSDEVRDALIDGAFKPGVPEWEHFIANGLVSATDSMEILLFGVDYRDVDTEEWYTRRGYFTYVVTNGLMAGYTTDPTSFGPEDDLTRAQFATILYRMANPNSQATTDPNHYADNETEFTDVQDGKWYTAAINWANQVGVLTGDTATNYTTVRPYDSLTREEAATMAYRFADAVGASTSVAGMSTPAVTDWDDVAGWARTAMKWCYHKGVLTGAKNPDGTRSMIPESTTTRAMMTKVATILHRDIMP